MVEESVVKPLSGTNNTLECSVCCGHEFFAIDDIFDDRYGHPDLFQLVRCESCGHMMTSPMLKEGELPDLYGTYYPRENISVADIESEARRVKSRFSKLRRWWIGTDNQGQYSAQPGEKMLDIGCGCGLSLLEAREMGVDVWGIEADPNVKRFADALNLRIHQGNLQDAPFEDVSFDLVVLNQVIEHIPEPDQALEIVRTRLANGGRVVLVFPNVDSLWRKISRSHWINWHIPYHLHHFSAKTFARMAARCGYITVRSKTITPNVWTILQLRANRQNVERGQANPMWAVRVPDSSPSSRAGSQISVRSLLITSVMTGIAIFNRIVDSLGLGDSLIVELRIKDS